MNRKKIFDSLKFQNIRLITAADDSIIAEIIRMNLKKFHLDIPGTAYFDPELDHLSEYYNCFPEKRAYFIATDKAGAVIGGVGIAEFDGLPNCAEVQKLYLTDKAKGKGFGKALMQAVETYAKEIGYRRLYLETHTNLESAIIFYKKRGYHQIDKPKETPHSTMNRFFLKELSF